MKNRLACFFLLVSAVCGVASLRINADTCTCSCCDGLGDSIVSNILNSSCSSNCVRMTPAECVAMTNSMLASLSSLETTATNIQSYSISAFRTLRHVQEDMHEIRTLVQQAVSSLATSNNNVHSQLHEIYRTLNTMSNVYSSVETPVSSMVYSNVASGASINISWLNRVSNYILRLNIFLDRAFLELRNFEEDVHSASSDVRSILGNDLLSFLDTVDFEISDTLQNLDPIPRETEAMMLEMSNLREVVASVSCDSCGSGGGSGGGGGGTTDFTPILASIQNLQDRLDYWFNRLFTLINNFYTDYNSARLTPQSGLLDFDDYSNSQNWFQRVEMLLYSMSSLGEENTEEIPETPDASSTYDSTKSQINTGLDTDKQDYTSKITSSFSEFKESLGDLLNHLSVFGVQSSDNLAGMLILSSETYGWELRIPQDYHSSLWYKFRVGFRVLWCLLTLSLYMLLLVVYCKFMINVAGAFIGWVNDSMG